MDIDLFDDSAPASPATASAQTPRRLPWADRLHGWLGGARAELHEALRRMDSLRNRLAAGAVAALLFGMLLTTLAIVHFAERETLHQAALREQVEADRFAAQLDRRLGDTRRGLEQLAVRIVHESRDRGPAGALDEARIGEVLDSQLLLRSMFASLFVADADGRVRAYTGVARAGQPASDSIADRQYFREAVATRRLQISSPLVGKAMKAPMVVFALPVLQGDRVIAVIGGGLRLTGGELLAGLDAAVDRRGGSRVTLADASGAVLAASDPAMALRAIDESPLLGPAVAAWRSAGRPSRYLQGAGGRAPQVVATAPVGETGWQLWRAVPAEELLRPLHAGQVFGLAFGVLLSTLLAAGLWLLLRRQLRPLQRIESHAVQLLNGEGGGEWPEGPGEVGRLARTLQHVWRERKQMEEFNEQVLMQLRSVMAAAPVGIAFTRDGHFQLVSAELGRLLGLDEAALRSLTVEDIFETPQAGQLALGEIQAAIGSGQPYVGEWVLRRADGGNFWASLRARPVDASDPAAGIIWSVNDHSAQVESRRKLEHAARHDRLTGVANRHGFDRELEHAFDQHAALGKPAALVVMDLDRFKPINDSAGHAAGDAMLVAVAEALGARVRGTDTVARLGGDEFAVLLPQCDATQAMRVALKLHQAVREASAEWEGRRLSVGASVGVAVLSPTHGNVAAWLADADAACYEAKRTGRDRVCVGRPAASCAEEMARVTVMAELTPIDG